MNSFISWLSNSIIPGLVGEFGLAIFEHEFGSHLPNYIFRYHVAGLAGLRSKSGEPTIRTKKNFNFVYMATCKSPLLVLNNEFRVAPGCTGCTAPGPLSKLDLKMFFALMSL